MKKMYEKIKNAGKKYLPAIALASALTYGANGAQASELPIDSSVRQNMIERQEKAYSDSLTSARDQFSEYIKDDSLTIGEQEKVYGALKSAYDYSEKVGKEIPSADKELGDLLSENLEGFDVGITSLENKLRSEGLNVSVETEATVVEVASVAVPLFSALFLAGMSLLIPSKDD